MCVRVSVCVCFVDASFTVAAQIQVCKCVCVCRCMYDYLYVYERERDCFYCIIQQTYDVGLHSRRHPMEFDAGTRPFASFDAPSS